MRKFTIEGTKGIDGFNVLSLGTRMLNVLMSTDIEVVICQWDMVNNVFVSMSASSLTVLGRPAEEFIGKGLEGFVREDFLNASYKEVEENQKRGYSTNSFVNVYVTPEGEERVIVWFSDATNERVNINFGFWLRNGALKKVVELVGEDINE